MAQPSRPLKTTPLNAIHRRLGAKMIDFGGWDMPVQYASLLEEHHAVRRRAGLFDVSHMGEIEIRGPDALRLVNYVATNDASRLHIGQAQYSSLLYEHGGFVDDILIHKIADDHYFLCVNASNQDKDYEHIIAHNPFHATVENAGTRYAQLAVQGPRANRPHWLHWRGWFRGVPATQRRFASLGRTSCRGRRIRNQALRPGRPQHAAPGGRHGPV
jgi:aminomethyltransferase